MTRFDEWIAARYERLWPELFDPAVIDPAVDVLAELAGDVDGLAQPGGLLRELAGIGHALTAFSIDDLAEAAVRLDGAVRVELVATGHCSRCDET